MGCLKIESINKIHSISYKKPYLDIEGHAQTELRNITVCKPTFILCVSLCISIVFAYIHTFVSRLHPSFVFVSCF